MAKRAMWVALVAGIAGSALGNENCLPENEVFTYKIAHHCMAESKTFDHPALCPLDAVCASYSRTDNTWLCHDGKTDPTQCDAENDRIMLLGRKVRSGIITGPEACINDSDCSDSGEKCYARRCVTGRSAGDEERLYAYINGACGTISPHVAAQLSLSADSAAEELLTIKCVLEDQTPPSDWKVLMTLSQQWPQMDQQFDSVFTNMFGQLQVKYFNEDGFSEMDSFIDRAFDSRAMAEACSLCSLSTARNYNTDAFITEDSFWECKVYSRSVNAPDNMQNCTELFGSRVFVARQGVRELETVGFLEEDVAPAYLVSGIVPQNLNEEWQAYTLAPPLFDNRGIMLAGTSTRTIEEAYTPSINRFNNELSDCQFQTFIDKPYTSIADENLPKLANCRRIISQLKLPHVDALFYQYPFDLPSNSRPVHGHFDRVWSFFNFATASDYRNFHFRGQPAYFNPTPKLRASSMSFDYSLVPDTICTAQMSYCCLSGPDLNGRTIVTREYYNFNNQIVQETTAQGSIRCGHANTRFYGLNHAFRASVCPIVGGNTQKDSEFVFREGSLLIGSGGTIATDSLGNPYDDFYAADVIVIPRTWQSGCESPEQIVNLECSGKVAYGWALLEDLMDVDRTVYNVDQDTSEPPAVCKYEPQQRDYCLRRDRGFATNNVQATTGHRCFMPLIGGTLGEMLQIMGNAEDICCDGAAEDDCDLDCLAFITGDVTTVSSTPTTTTTTGPSVVQDDVVRALVMYDSNYDPTAYYSGTNMLLSTPFDRPEPGTSTKVCSVAYRYMATDSSNATEPKTVMTYTDATATAHTQCRDYCTTWADCIAYSYAQTTCRLYGNVTIHNLDYRSVDINLGEGVFAYRFTTIHNKPVLQYDNPTAVAVVEQFSAQLSIATEFDGNAVLREFVGGVPNGANAAFDFFHGVVPCFSEGSRTLRALTANECIEHATVYHHNAFMWLGRLNQCIFFVEQVQSPASVSWNCTGAEGYRYVQSGENVGIFAVKTSDTICPSSTTTTTRVETVSTAPLKSQRVAVYTSLPRLCGDAEAHFIGPVFLQEGPDRERYELLVPIKHTQYYYSGENVIGENTFDVDAIWLDPKTPPVLPCVDEPPVGIEVYGGPDTTPTTTPSTTTPTPTFVNRFTEEDTRVATGVALGILGLGTVFVLVAAARG